MFYGLLKNGRYQIPKGKLGVYPSLFIVSAYNERERDSDSLLLIPQKMAYFHRPRVEKSSNFL